MKKFVYILTISRILLVCTYILLMFSSEGGEALLYVILGGITEAIFWSTTALLFVWHKPIKSILSSYKFLLNLNLLFTLLYWSFLWYW